MLEGFQQTDFSDIDFSFVSTLDEESLNFFFEVTDYAVQAMKQMIETDRAYVTNLPLVQNQEITIYYNKLLNLYTDYELYEECSDILFVLNSLEGALETPKEIVGSLQ